MSIAFSHGADAHVRPARRTNFHAGRHNGHNDQRSVSGPDEGRYASFPDMLKGEADSDDENLTLTSQTLNADGTPKRPMNAFMIFARRRRPQVSAANHSMRTGEISKILSKEWNTMQAIEKQFYQDQAKQLKDSFNTRYPDYVYRRRPNNSRRKRKPDSGGVRQVDKPVPLDMGDDGTGLGDAGESLTDPEDTRSSSSELRENSYSDTSKFTFSHTRPFSYAYPMTDHGLHSNGSHEGGFLYGQDTSSAGRSSHNLPLSASIAPAPAPHPPPYTYVQPRSHFDSAPSFGPDYSHETYEAPVARPVPWPLGNSHDRPAAQKPHSSTSANRLAWNCPSLTSSSPTFGTTFLPSYALPTLGSPFYPSQAQSEGSTSTCSPHPNSASQSPFISAHVQPASSPKIDHDNSTYSTMSSSSPTQARATLGRDMPSYSGRNANQYFSHFAPQPHPSPPGSVLGTQVHWSRD